MEHSLGTLKELLNFNLTNNNSMADKTDVPKKNYRNRSGKWTPVLLYNQV